MNDVDAHKNINDDVYALYGAGSLRQGTFRSGLCGFVPVFCRTLSDGQGQ
jgi:hypothetical protein